MIECAELGRRDLSDEALRGMKVIEEAAPRLAAAQLIGG